jgi:hypothetical protein
MSETLKQCNIGDDHVHNEVYLITEWIKVPTRFGPRPQEVILESIIIGNKRLEERIVHWNKEHPDTTKYVYELTSSLKYIAE